MITKRDELHALQRMRDRAEEAARRLAGASADLGIEAENEALPRAYRELVIARQRDVERDYRRTRELVDMLDQAEEVWTRAADREREGELGVRVTPEVERLLEAEGALGGGFDPARALRAPKGGEA